MLSSRLEYLKMNKAMTHKHLDFSLGVWVFAISEQNPIPTSSIGGSRLSVRGFLCVGRVSTGASACMVDDSSVPNPLVASEATGMHDEHHQARTSSPPLSVSLLQHKWLRYVQGFTRRTNSGHSTVATVSGKHRTAQEQLLII
jgi:hypothetical protein